MGYIEGTQNINPPMRTNQVYTSSSISAQNPVSAAPNLGDAKADSLTIGGSTYWSSSSTVANTGTVTLPTILANYSAHGYVRVSHASTGAIEESTGFEIDSTGTVAIMRCTSDIVANANTAGKFCLGSAATQNPIVLLNNLGAAKNVMVELWCTKG